MFAVGDQIEVISELNCLGDLLQDVNTETFAATLDVNPWITCMIADRCYREEEGKEKTVKLSVCGKQVMIIKDE